MHFKPETLVESPERKEMSNAGATRRPKESESRVQVRITAFDKGPMSFYVHIASKDDEYQKFQTDLQKFSDFSCHAKEAPQVGSKWIARIDKQLFRIKVVETNEKLPASRVMVRQLETGLKIAVEVANLFKIPSEIEHIPPYAKHFKLAGIERGCVGSLSQAETDFYFQYVTKVKLLTMKVISMDGEKI